VEAIQSVFLATSKATMDHQQYNEEEGAENPNEEAEEHEGPGDG
jgi:hypothetical protein